WNVLQLALAPAFEIGARSRHLLARRGLIDTEAFSPRHRGGHLEQAVVVTRDATGGLEEHRVRVLQPRQADRDGLARRSWCRWPLEVERRQGTLFDTSL